MAWHKTKKASKLPGMDKSKILVFDTETTGLEPAIDEILQITILDGYGSTLFNSYIKPNHHKKWPAAKKVNHISYEMVKTAPTFKEVRSQIQDIFNKAELVVGYNVNFDINFVEAAGIIVSGKKFDVMTAFSSFYSDVENAIYKWHTLSVCADYFGYSFNAHDSAEDAAATLYCFNGLISDERFTTYEPKKSVYQYRKPRTEKKKVAFSIEVKAQRRSTLLFRGMLLFFIGEIIYYLMVQRFIVNYKDFYKEVIACIIQQPINVAKTIGLILIGIGCLMFVLGTLRAIIRFPRWIVTKIKRFIINL